MEHAWTSTKKTLKQFSHSDPLDSKVQEALLPIYTSLSSDDSLKRCVGGLTQNNESFNKTVRQFIPKHIYCSSTTISIAAYIVVCMFNEGANTLLKMLEIMGVKIGPNTKRYATISDEERIQQADRCTQYESREKRMARKKEKLAEQDEFEEIEGLLYGPGIAE